LASVGHFPFFDLLEARHDASRQAFSQAGGKKKSALSSPAKAAELRS